MPRRFSLSTPKLPSVLTSSHSPSPAPPISDSTSSVNSPSDTSSRKSTESLDSIPKEIIYSDTRLPRSKTNSSLNDKPHANSIPNILSSLPSISNPLTRHRDSQTHSRRTSDPSTAVPNSSALYTPLRIAVLDRVLAKDPSAVINEYTLTPERDGTKNITAGSETFDRVAAFALKKFLSVMGGRDNLNERWEAIKKTKTENDIVGHGKGVKCPDVLLASTYWDGETETKAGNRLQAHSAQDVRDSSTEQSFDQKIRDQAIVTRIWSLRRGEVIVEFVWNGGHPLVSPN